MGNVEYLYGQRYFCTKSRGGPKIFKYRVFQKNCKNRKYESFRKYLGFCLSHKICFVLETKLWMSAVNCIMCQPCYIFSERVTKQKPWHIFFKFKQNLVTKANDGILVHRKSSKICFYGLYRVIL